MLQCLSGNIRSKRFCFYIFKNYQGDFADFNVDNLDNIYLITATNQLKRSTVMATLPACLMMLNATAYVFY